MTIGELNRRIKILALHEERDSFGGVVGDWYIHGRVWAKIDPTIGLEHLTNQHVEGSQTATMTMRFYPALTTKHRIEYEGTFYEITAIKDITTGHRWTEATVKELKDGIQREAKEGTGNA